MDARSIDDDSASAPPANASASAPLTRPTRPTRSYLAENGLPLDGTLKVARQREEDDGYAS